MLRGLSLRREKRQRLTACLNPFSVKRHAYGIGTFPIFSGQNSYINDSRCAYLPNSAIPVGRYWIVERPQGSEANT